MSSTHRTAVPARNDEGAIALLVALVLSLGLLAFTGIVVDAGAYYSERRQLQTAADAAALAGAKDLVVSQAAAIASANKYAGLNSPAGETLAAPAVDFPSASKIHVVVSNPSFGLFFARFVGKNSASVGAEATAIIPSPSGYPSGVVPIGVPPEAVQFPQNHAPTTLKFDPGNAIGPGKFGWTSLTTTRIQKKGIEDALDQGGVSYEVKLGPVADRSGENDWKIVSKHLDPYLAKDTCIGAGQPTMAAHFAAVVTVNPDGSVVINDPTCKRLVICPVVSGLDTHSPVIVGFAWFFIDETSESGQSITGRFVRPVIPQDWADWGDYDPYGSVGPPKLYQ